MYSKHGTFEDLDEFCETYSGEYLHDDDLIDTPNGVDWVDIDGHLKGRLQHHNIDEVTNWVYINLK